MIIIIFKTAETLRATLSDFLSLSEAVSDLQLINKSFHALF